MNNRILPAFLSLTIVFLGLSFPPKTVFAGETGFSRQCSKGDDCLRCPKRYWIHSPYRQCEDSRRYNAAPCTPPRYASAKKFHRPTLIQTVVLSEKTEPRSYLDSKGNRHTSYATVITYKDLYSNGDCKTRTKTIAGSYK